MPGAVRVVRGAIRRGGCITGEDSILALTPSASPRIVCASQGGVQFPTGGIPFLTGSPRALPGVRKVSRSGERPEPTVTVRMEEKTATVHGRERFFLPRPDSRSISKEKHRESDFGEF